MSTVSPGLASPPLTLHLLVVPNVTIVPTPPAPQPLIEGRDALILDCEVEANPEPSISWYKDINTESGGVPRLQEQCRLPWLAWSCEARDSTDLPS